MRIRACTTILGLVAAVLTVGVAPAVAAPGVPQAPATVFTEGFERGQGATPMQVTSYTGPPPENMTYAADAAFLANCNGWLASQQQPVDDPPGLDCGGFYRVMEGMAAAIGQYAGTGAGNHALANGTAFVGPGVGNTVLRTTSPIAVPANRFLTLSVDAGAVGCGSVQPRMDFYLLSGATPHPTSAGPVNFCAGSGTVNGVTVGTHVGDRGVLLPGTSAGIQVVNRSDGDAGNDSVLDNLEILDVTPQLDKAFSAATVTEHGSVTLVYTVTNTSERGAKNGWSFTDAMPAGLVASSATTTCAGGATSVTPTAIRAEGNLGAGQTSCVVRLEVSAAHPGTFTTCGAEVTAVGGLNRPGCASVYFNAEPDVSAGGPYAGREGTAVDLAGQVSDVDGPGLSHLWTVIPGGDVDPGTSCVFGDATAQVTTVRCDDDGTYTLTLTGDDGFNPPVSTSTTLTLTNVAPQVAIASPANGDLFVRGTPVTFTAPFTDIGTHDTHTCTVDLVDGVPIANGTVTETPGAGTCVLTHSFTKIGPHHVLVRITDDDGAAATAVVTVVVYLPGEAFALSATGPVGIPRTPLATCPPDESHTVATLATLVGSLTALHADCTLDRNSGTTVAHGSLGSASLLGGAITITDVTSTCVSSAEAITRSSTVGTINGIPIGYGTGSLGIPGVATVYYNETTTTGGKLVQNAIRVRTLLGQEIILAGCRLG